MIQALKGKWLLISVLLALPLWYISHTVCSAELMVFCGADREQSRSAMPEADFWKGVCLETDYFLFRQVPVKGMIAGEQGFLFTRDELQKAAGGDYFSGADVIAGKALRVAQMQQLLDSFGLPLVVLAGPSRPYVCKAYVPRYWLKRSWPTDYDQFAEEAKAGRFKYYIDFQTWALSVADTSRFPIMNPMGPDWSAYGRQLWADTLLKWLDARFEADLPRLQLLDMKVSRHPCGDETGYWKMTGLLYHKHAQSMQFADPSVAVIREGKWTPRVLGVSRDHFSSVQWLCSRLDGNTWDRMDATSLREQLEQLALADVVLLMEGEAAIRYLGQGWVEMLQRAPREELLRYLRAGQRIRSFRKNEELMKSFTHQAWKEQVEVEQLLLRAALR